MNLNKNMLNLKMLRIYFTNLHNIQNVKNAKNIFYEFKQEYVESEKY